MPEEPKRKRGRPSTYSPEMAARICTEISSGKSLRKICTRKDMPSMQTVFMWIGRHKEFADQYARAQSDRTTYWAEEIVEISDDDKVDPQRARLRVDTRKWLMSKMAPKKYGDRVQTEVTGRDGGPVKINLQHATDEQLKALEGLLSPIAGASGDDTEGDQSGEGEA